MLHKCANPDCTNPFRKLSEGKLFLVETEAAKGRFPKASWDGTSGHHLEHFWLCAGCSQSMTLTYEKGRGIVTVQKQMPPKPERLRISNTGKAEIDHILQKPA